MSDLPPGWKAEWSDEHRQYYFINEASGTTQWEPPMVSVPASEAPIGDPGQEAPQPQAHGKRRQYATGQSQAYTGTAETAPQWTDPSAGYQQPGGQLFTPGFSGDTSMQQQQQQAAPYYAGQADFGQQGAPVAQLGQQFGQMNLQGNNRPVVNMPINLIGTPLNVAELEGPPPEIFLPPNVSLSQTNQGNADPSYMRSTINAVPTTHSLLNKSKIPFTLVLTPHRSLQEGDEAVPVITDGVIARCRRCRSYINPYVTFIDGGNRWRCILCNMPNDVPQLFDWDQERNQSADRWSRLELNYSCVEFVAGVEYMSRPPQPPVYVFLLDVSHAAVQSGMLATAVRTIADSLDRLPNKEDRTKIAIICVDVALHFFAFTPGTSEYTMLVVSDLDDVFLPKPTDILVNLTEAKAGVEALLEKIPDLFAESHAVGSALGPALQAAYKMTTPIGCKIIVLTASLPTLGPGALKNREDPKLLGTAKESSLLRDANSFYKSFAIDCSRSHISVDMFLFSASYTDVATLNTLPHYTSGQTYYYPAFSAARSEDALKFAHEFGKVLETPIGFEGLVRVRASKGLRMSSFHGNFFVSSSDLLSMPSIPQDQSYSIEVEIEDDIKGTHVVFQTASLHTNCEGERRIRVITLALPTTTNISQIYASADQVAIATFLASKAVERSISHKLEDARDAVTNKVGDILNAYRSSMTAGGASAQLSVPENLKFLPLLCLGLIKHVGLRQSSQIPPDLRAYAQALLSTLPSQQLIPYIHPNLYALHTMPPEAGTIGENGRLILPGVLPASSEFLERHGLYLIEDGQTMFLWVGRDAVPQLIMDVFELPTYADLRGGKGTIPLLENPFSQRVNAVIAKVREMRRGVYRPYLFIVKEDGEPALRSWALSALIQDRADSSPSYAQYLTKLKEKVNSSS
ncbi:CPII coat sec24 protein [Clavulina sp. PMI_390]|nr:CPII coat sec24 protein [Clavulina sp. PMI_390]